MPINPLFPAAAGLLLCLSAHAGLLPDDADPDPNIPAPADVLGFETGERHPMPAQAVAYLRALDAASDRVWVETIGRSHGGRELVLAHFADTADAERIGAMRERRHEQARSGEGRLVIWLGYNVHGDEASGASAALETAYYLAAARSQRVRELLADAVVVMEPLINPDGLARFAHWANRHRGEHPSADPADREHAQGWPEGRTNYYWFDLNRDWLPLVHPESRARLARYHQWRPHLVTDVHEMGHAATYFFQPGVPERTNPLTPATNQRLTDRLADYHACGLDARDEAFYTRESFDDFYIGKGSTFPDVTGGVGVLFEQASARGHRIDTPEGVRTYADAIANQFTTSLTSLHGAHEMADDFRAYQAEFFDDPGADADHAGWVIGDGGDPARAGLLVERLVRHGVRVHRARQTVDIDGEAQGTAWVVPAEQEHYRLAKAMLDPIREFDSTVFYDVSTWWMPAAFDVPVSTVRRLPEHADEVLAEAPVPAGDLPAGDGLRAIEWNQVAAPAALHALLEAGVTVRVATEPATLTAAGGERIEFGRGSLIVPAGADRPALRPLLEPFVAQGLVVHAVSGGRAAAGVDPGSPSMVPLEPVRPLVVTGSGVSPYSAGAIWHWFDQRLAAPVAKVDWTNLGGTDLSGYTHIIVPDGNWMPMPQWLPAILKTYVEAGGSLVAIRRGIDLVGRIGFEPPLSGQAAGEGAQVGRATGGGADGGDDGEDTEWRRYGDWEDAFSKRWIGGAILALDLDTSHPLGFGYDDDPVPVFRQGIARIEPPDNPFAAPGRYTEDPLMSGYVSDLRIEQLAGVPGLTVDHRGRGRVIRIADDYLFRGFFAGTWRLFANVIFFAQVIEPRQLPE